MKKERPIIFSGDMIRAILEGRKTVTRRIVKCSKELTCFGYFRGDRWTLKPHSGGGWMGSDGDPERMVELDSRGFQCPYGQVGDRLWVRETWQLTTWEHPSSENYGYIYRASENGKAWEENYESFTWRSPIFMPRSASRITLEITNVRVERLQDITPNGILKEGVQLGTMTADFTDKLTPEFHRRWDNLNGKRASWESNPWVWVIEFKKLN